MSADRRIRTVSLGVIALLTAAAPTVVPLASGSASAAGVVETCQEQPATIVATGDTTTGTEGPDVIVAAVGRDVNGLGGDDLICIRGLTRSVMIRAGEGDDSVAIEGDGGVPIEVLAVLGLGDDRYVGGPGSDGVSDFDPDAGDDGGSIPDGGDDIIRTLGGNDGAEAGGRTGPAQTDGIDLGEGDDTLTVGNSGATPASRLRGGAGHDLLRVYSLPGRRMGLGLGDRVVDGAGRVLARGWTDFQEYLVLPNQTVDNTSSEGPPWSIGVRGSEQADRVTLLTSGEFAADTRLDIDLEYGDDYLRLDPGVQGRVNAGPGRDVIGVSNAGTAGRETTRLDLARQRLTLTRRTRYLTLVRFQDAFVDRNPSRYTGPVVVVGNDDPNRLSGCGALYGGLGNDAIRAEADPARQCSGFRAFGGPGRDRLVGSASNDVLDGGPAYDTANGYSGTDTCRAERRTACER